MDLRTSRVFFTIFGQCINVLNYNVDYSITDCFKLLFKTITCNKFLQIKSVYVLTFVAILLTSNGPCMVHVLATQK